MALYINGQLQTMSSKIRYNESTDMVQIYYQGQWHDWKTGGVNVPDGSTVTPINDVTIWQQCAGITNPTYTTLADVLADSSILSILINSNNAVDYMVRSTNWTTSVCTNSNAMQYIGQNNYASNTLLADSDWREAICNSTYFESVLNVKVPTMTSATTPSGEVSAKDYYDENFPYYAFDGKLTSPYYWRANSNPSWIKYDFGKTAKFYFVGVMNQSGSGRSFSATVSGSLDNSTFNTMSDSFSCPDNGVMQYAHLDGSSCRYLRLDTDATGASYPQALVQKMNFYGREDV